nr:MULTISPECIES: arylesterase [unclassified Roseovarius]
MAGFLFLAAPLSAEEVTVLALGDSLTQGFGLPEAQGFVPQMQAWLRGQGADVTLINAGVSGDTTAGGAARVEWSLTPEVDVMILALGANDMLRGIDPDVSRENLSKILTVARAQEVEVLLVGLKAPANLGAGYKSDFDAIFPELAAAFGVAYAPDFFVGLEGTAPADLPTYFLPDRLHPNADGVARIVEGLGPSVLELVTPD